MQLRKLISPREMIEHENEWLDFNVSATESMALSIKVSMYI